MKNVYYVIITKNVYYIIITSILSFRPLLFQALVTFPTFQNSPKHLECHLWYMTDKPHRLSLKLDPGTNWIEINWWKVKLWQFWKTLPTVEWVQTREFNWRIPVPCMPWKSTTFLLHCTRGHRLGWYWLNSRTRPMILFSTLVRSPTVRSGISLLLFHCDHCLFRSVQVPESEEPHAK